MQSQTPFSVPRKHKLNIWKKTTTYFPDSAIKLGASVFTNGSFNLYSGKNPGWLAVIKYHAELTWLKFQIAGIRAVWKVQAVFSPFYNTLLKLLDFIETAAIDALKQKYYGNTIPEGYIYGKRDNITETSQSRPKHHHFGRKSGRAFADYVIARGEAPAIDEVIGGLFRTVDNYTDANDNPRDLPSPDGVSEKHQTNDMGYWGLVPLAIDDPILRKAGLEGALESLSSFDRRNYPDLPSTPLPGLLFIVFFGGDTSVMAQNLISVRVKDAVRIDGSDSILFGRDTTILVGDGDKMSERKKLYNHWGYCCRKE